MSDFQTSTASASATTVDPYKRVLYSQGMMLGVDDFDQEFAYLSNRDQWLARDTLGYGTVCGLQVKIETDDRGPRVQVEPGVALSPAGQLIRVTPAQCAYLNDWIAAHRDDVLRRVGAVATSNLTLYLVLCYRECPTDPVPIPGEPCRDESEATENSRLKDDFELKLCWQAPDQVEEDAVRDFVAWLRQIEISDNALSTPLDEFLSAIRSATYLLQSPPATPPSPPDFMYGSPPAGLVINSDDVCRYLRAALRVWVTELRPLWRGAACDGIPSQNCVLLAQIDVPLVGTLVSSTDRVAIDEERRPYLVHLRMLQELLICGLRGGSNDKLSPAAAVIPEQAWGLPDSVGTLIQEYALADHTHGTPPAPVIPDGPQPSMTVTNEIAFGQGANAGNSALYSRADHTHGTPPAPVVPAQPQPSDTVQPETAFGQAANAGNSAQYSRADHTHGTPAGGTVAGDFVEHPTGLPRYLIVAAGIARANGKDAAFGGTPSYDALTLNVQGGSSSNLLVGFGPYAPPKAGNYQYIIKAMPVFEAEVWKAFKLVQPVVNFAGYDAKGIILHVTDVRMDVSSPGEPISAAALEQLAFVIEVSQYLKPDLRRLRGGGPN